MSEDIQLHGNSEHQCVSEDELPLTYWQSHKEAHSFTSESLSHDLS